MPPPDQSTPSGVRVVFGAGSSKRISQEMAKIGVSAPVVVCSPSRADLAAALVPGARVVAIAKEHVPVEIVERAMREIANVRADAVVAIGGGSAIGLAKAMAREAPLKVIAVPTTYSGSEMTPVYGTTRDGKKTTGRDERVRPALVIYDSDLTRDLPRAVTIPSLWNALAHAVEALWVTKEDTARAEKSIRLLANAARALAKRQDAAARDEALEGAYLAGLVFAEVGGGLHHKLCHALGGAFGLPHASTHAVLLPYVARVRLRDLPAARETLERALGGSTLETLARETRAPTSLRDLASNAVLDFAGLARVASSMPDDDRTRALEVLVSAFAPLRAPDAFSTQPGFGGTHTSEALPGALPKTQNAPRRAPYGAYPELLNGTPFTTRSADNSRVWMYRVRPSFDHGRFAPVAPNLFAAPLGDVEPNRVRWQPLPIPDARTDFVDGLVTLGGDGDLRVGPGWSVHLYAANADMIDRAFSNADGDLLIVPQEGTLDCRTELGWLRASPGTILLVPRAIKFAIGLPDGRARGWMLEVVGRRLRLPERGLIGSNGLADARHFLAPVASYEDRTCPNGFEIVHKLGGVVHAATQAHSAFDVIAWHGAHAPFSYDLSLFSPMGAVAFDHADPSILTVLSAPLDDHGRSLADFVIFPPRWEVIEHSFRPPFMHRNAASEINMVVRTAGPGGAYAQGQTFLSPLLTSHGVTTRAYDAEIDRDEDAPPQRIPDASLWAMFESALPFRTTKWAREPPLVDASFDALFTGMKKRFDPSRP